MDESFGHMPLLDAVDLDILMHKEAHFGGNFSIMIDYYAENGVGVMPDFELSRIEELQAIERSLGTSLAEHLLPPQAMEQVKLSKKLYHDLRQVYSAGEKTLGAKLSDLILTEKELPMEEIQAILKFSTSCFEPLCQLVTNPNLYDPLFPGYGRTPIFAAMALENLQDQRALPYLFPLWDRKTFLLTTPSSVRSSLSKRKGKISYSSA